MRGSHTESRLIGQEQSRSTDNTVFMLLTSQIWQICLPKILSALKMIHMDLMAEEQNGSLSSPFIWH